MWEGAQKPSLFWTLILTFSRHALPLTLMELQHTIVMLEILPLMVLLRLPLTYTYTIFPIFLSLIISSCLVWLNVFHTIYMICSCKKIVIYSFLLITCLNMEVIIQIVYSVDRTCMCWLAAKL